MIRLARAVRFSKITGVIGADSSSASVMHVLMFLRSEGSKFTDTDLEAVINDPNKPIFSYMRMKKAVS